MVRQRRYSSGFLLAELSVLVGALILGCTQDRPALPTQSPRADLLSDDALNVGHINQLLIALFPAGLLLDSARDQLNNIQPLLAQGDIPGAQSQALHLADFTIKGYRAGQLLDPNGTLPLTTPEAVVELFDVLLRFVGLPPSGLTSDALGPTGPSGTSDVFGALGGTLATVEALAGLSVPADAVSGDHLFLITRRDDLALQGTCLSTPLPQYPLDRKSTRLNSSHSQISYAVFCLKKKTHYLAGELGQLVAQLVHLRATLADHHAGTARVHRHRDLPRLALDVNVGDGRMGEPGLQVLPDQVVFLQELGEVVTRVEIGRASCRERV